MNLTIPQYALDKLQDIGINKGFTNISIDIAPGANYADGFIGILSRVIINGRDRVDGKIKQLTLILKLPPSNEIRRQQFSSNALFEREILAYTKILPTLCAFQEAAELKYPDQGFFNYPKCYASIFDPSNATYGLVLEDLKQSGFKMWNKFDIIDYDHVALVLGALGKFHAISFAFRDQKPNDFNELINNLEDIHLTKLMNEATLHFKDISFNKAIATLDPAVNTEAIRKMIEMKENFLELFTQCLSKNVAGRFSVFNHGDCWSNNIMFSYDKANHVKSISFVDFQLLRYASPALDLVYFLFTSTHKELRHHHYTDLIKFYYKCLSETIRQLGSDPEKLFTFADLQDQLKQFGKYGLLMSPMLLQIISTDPQDIPDMDDFAERMQKEGVTATIEISEHRQSAFEIRMRDVIEDIFSYNYY